jgi:hypothetical protein
MTLNYVVYTDDKENCRSTAKLRLVLVPLKPITYNADKQ